MSLVRGLLCGLPFVLLAGCAAAPGGKVAPPDAPSAGIGPEAGLPPPACASNTLATLENGVAVSFEGSVPGRPDVCVARWQGRAHEYYLGFWGDGRPYSGSEDERAAVRRALTGPVGTQAEFAARGATLWKGVTVTHVANPVLIVDGRPRPTVELRQVMHDAHGRADVRAEFLHWVDQATGIALQRQTVTQLADGKVVPQITWQVRSLRDE